MVLQKRLDYGFHGYQVPRATRSARRMVSILKKSEENQMCAFDLLATVAGELLLERATSPTAVVNLNDANETLHVENLLKSENIDSGTCDKSDFLPEQGIPDHNQDLNLTHFPVHQNGVCSRLASVSTTPGCSEKINFTKELLPCKADSELGGFGCKIEVDFTGFRMSSNCHMGDNTIKDIKLEPLKSENESIGSEANSADPMVWEGKPNAPVMPVSNAKAPLCTDHIRSSSSLFGNDVKLVSRDDDENSFRTPSPPSPCIGDRRIKKILASKYCKVAPRLTDEKIANTNSRNFNSLYRTRKSCYKSQMFQRNCPFKKRRLSRSISNSGRGNRSGGISYSLKKGLYGDGIGLRSKLHGVIGSLSSGAGQNTSLKSRDSHVKLRIKSFRVPEFFIEMPETATVGLLKRRVMEAVTAILSGGLHVGVLLQGKKVRDDSKTLLQTGISHDNQQLDSLGFSLEPNSSQAPPPLLCTGNKSCLLPLDTPEPLTRYLPPSTVVLLGNSESYVESDHDSVPSPTDMALENFATHCKGLVPLSALSVEAQAMTPMHSTSKRSDASQRRIRRPFSVSEVEALVEAVEKLGTGRWRDVKIRAFDNAKHRTYVDLKDKWKTLVHTARISPQQRRGEPVPQELLDRVLTAHSFWTQQTVR